MCRAAAVTPPPSYRRAVPYPPLQILDFNDAGPPVAGGAAGGAGPAARATRLTVLGLSPTDFLMAEDLHGGGGCYEYLTPDGNSLDMMQGLIRRKVQ